MSSIQLCRSLAGLYEMLYIFDPSVVWRRIRYSSRCERGSFIRLYPKIVGSSLRAATYGNQGLETWLVQPTSNCYLRPTRPPALLHAITRHAETCACPWLASTPAPMR